MTQNQSVAVVNFQSMDCFIMYKNDCVVCCLECLKFGQRDLNADNPRKSPQTQGFNDIM